MSDVPRLANILLIEDNPGDVCLTREALRAGKLHNPLFVATDGVEGLDALHQRGRFEGGPRMDLVLLDLNLPRMDGREVLGAIRSDEHLRRTPVVILTSSRSEEDVVRSYDLQANAYVAKPMGVQDHLTIVQGIERFWLQIVRLP